MCDKANGWVIQGEAVLFQWSGFITQSWLLTTEHVTRLIRLILPRVPMFQEVIQGKEVARYGT
ncbi:MAG: hypothetical protein AAGA75_15005 [Cyanobacteria bacterium P01_E01_bin.6]